MFVYSKIKLEIFSDLFSYELIDQLHILVFMQDALQDAS